MVAVSRRTAHRLAALGAIAAIPLQVVADQTDITQRLNGLIRASGYPAIYTAAPGILVRNPFDGYEDDTSKKVVPATFLHNDIFAANKVFPSFDIKTGMDFEVPPMVYVIGSAMKNLFYDFDHIQSDPHWGWGVFYPWDSNAADARCRWLSTFNTYDCPGYAITWGEKPKEWPSNKGAGSYPAGNPQANPSWGGGAGCHFSGLPYGCHDPVPCIYEIDQAKRSPIDLVQDRDCQCNYKFNDNWEHWVQTLYGIEKNILPEAAMCWVNNPRDLIKLQNALFWHRQAWFTSEGQPTGPTGYWGWNEIPVSREAVSYKGNWDAVAIKMPIFSCGPDGSKDSLKCVSTDAQKKLEATLDQWVGAGYIVPGVANIGKRPGSYVVLFREWKDGSGNHFSYFFCEAWTSPSGKYAVRFKDAWGGDPGYCYLDKLLGDNATATVVV